MEANMKIFAFLLLLGLCNTGSADQCSLSDLVVTQTGGSPTYAVQVENKCICTQGQVKLSCAGFSSSMGVDPEVLRPDGDGRLCILNGDRSIGMGPEYAVKFQYTSSSQISFEPVSSTIACS